MFHILSCIFLPSVLSLIPKEDWRKWATHINRDTESRNKISAFQITYSLVKTKVLEGNNV